MADTRAPGWHRVGLRGAVVPFLIMLTAILMVIGYFAAQTALAVVATLPRLEARPLRALGDATAGPGVYAGAIVGPTVKTPLGLTAVGYVAWLDQTTGSGKSSSTKTVCKLERFGWTGLRSGETTVGLPKPAEVTWLGPNSLTAPAPGRFHAGLIPQATGGPPPDELFKSFRCERPTTGTLAYHEQAVFLGTTAVVSGCREGAAITLCRDELDFMVARCRRGIAWGECTDPASGVATMVDYWAGGTRTLLGLVLGIVGGLIAIGGFLVLRNHTRDRRRRHVGAEAH